MWCQGTLIPTGETIERFELVGNISWILVVEKEVLPGGCPLYDVLIRIVLGRLSNTVPLPIRKSSIASWPWAHNHCD
jgi:hypothetical protein